MKDQYSSLVATALFLIAMSSVSQCVKAREPETATVQAEQTRQRMALDQIANELRLIRESCHE